MINKANKVVFNKKTGRYGITRFSWRTREKKLVICPINLVTLDYSWRDTISWEGNVPNNWTFVSRNHELQKYFEVLDTIYDADWYFSLPENVELDEFYIENPRDIYLMIQKILER